MILPISLIILIIIYMVVVLIFAFLSPKANTLTFFILLLLSIIVLVVTVTAVVDYSTNYSECLTEIANNFCTNVHEVYNDKFTCLNEETRQLTEYSFSKSEMESCIK